MSWIVATDPLALVAIQAGQVGTPTSEAAAAGNSNLDTAQRSITIGEPVPIAFCRRRNGAGGVLVSPGATEARFENDASNAVTASYLLVVSEGQLPGIEVRDVFLGPCRLGSHSQTYNRRAGTWTPGNFIVQRTGYDLPIASYYCGSVGSYPGITTVSYQVTIPDGFDNWRKQVHFFLRGGMIRTRLADGVTGPSDNFADLARWMMLTSGRFPAALIDTARLTATAQFLENLGLTCNCWITESSNYLDYLAQWAPLFLVCESNVAGKRGLRPILPVTAGNQINTGAIAPVFTFTEDHIFSDSLEIQYTSLAQRRPFVAQGIWRQQLEDDFGILRTAEVRFDGTADGPYESHDLSEFCTSENHAVKVCAYILARRVYTTHTARFTVKPQANNTAVTQGDIIRVRLARQTNAAGVSYHDYLYQVQRITKTMAGQLSYECTHFPVDDQGRSLIALAVANTTGSGILLSSNRSGLSCDLNSKTDQTVPAETYKEPDASVTDAGRPVAPGRGGSGSSGTGGGIYPGNGGSGGGVAPNPDDGLDYLSYPPHSVIGPSGVSNPQPITGAALDPGQGLCGTSGRKSLTWYKNGVKVVTFTLTGGSNVTTYESGQPRPSWLSAADGILAIGVGDVGNVYTSVTECNNGIKVGYTTAVQAGLYSRSYEFRFRGGEPTWQGGLYASENYPPYLERTEFIDTVYAYRTGTGWFGAASGPSGSIQELEIIPR